MKPRDWKPGYAGPDTAPEAGGDLPERREYSASHDYTPEILRFLDSVHGNTRQDDLGDYYYDTVSTISLHALLRSPLPAKEMLWAWYDYFDRERSESIYQTVAPLHDEAFLGILEAGAVRWDVEAVRRSGLVFLSRHRKEVYAAIEVFLTERLEAHQHMGDEALRELLTPRHTWTDSHLRREVRRLQTKRFSRDERQSVYRALESDYLRATARHLMDEAAREAFWKHPPPELESLRARFQALRGTLAEEAMRLGVFVSREAYSGNQWQAENERSRRGRRRAGARAAPGASAALRTAAEHFAVLGLTPAATLGEVKAAYREQVKAHHPDQGGDVPTFLRLQEAYEFLVSQVF